MVDLARQNWRDYEVDGVAASGKHKPLKSKIRQWGTWVESVINAFTSNGGLVYATRALLYADLLHGANTSAWVVSDSTGSYNGIYQKSGISGAGAWTRIADLPYSFISCTDSGAGTANAIVATSSISAPSTAGAALFLCNIFEANSGAVTLALNGAAAKPVITNSGNALSSGYLVAGMQVMFIDDGTNWRLVSDVASAAVLSGAEAAQDAAELAAANAALYDGVWFDTVALMLSDVTKTYSNTTAGDYIRTRAEGFSYQVAASGASDHDEVMAGGLKLYGKGASDLRKHANVRGAINFFDFLDGYSAADRESIAAGTYSGDLATPWTAFRNALAAVDTAGGRPHGVIPECTIKTSVSPNFAIDFLRLETKGNVRVHGTAGNAGMLFDGSSIGVGGYGIRHMEIDPIEGSSSTGSVGFDIQWCHKSRFHRPISFGGSFAGIRIRGCVTSVFDTPTVSPQAEAWLNSNRPSVPIYVSSSTGTTDGGVIDQPCSWSTLINPCAEYGINACMQLDTTYGMTVIGGAAQGGITGTGYGLVVGANSRWGKYIGIDCEFNTGIDVYCFGPNNTFIGVDSQDIIKFEGASAFGNTVIGGKHWLISLDADTRGNFVQGADANSVVDSSTGANANRVHDIKLRTTQEIDASFTGWRSEYTAYTPTYGATAGTITTATASGRWAKRGNTVTISAKLAITNNGTGSGAVTLTLPFVSPYDIVMTGREIQATGDLLLATIAAGTNVMAIHIAPLTYPGAAGRTLLMEGSYEIA